MKKVVMVSSACIVIVVILIIMMTKSCVLADVITTNDINKIEILLFGDKEMGIEITDETVIKDSINRMNEIPLRKRYGEPKTGWSYEVLFHHKNNGIDNMIVSGEVAINDVIYKCENAYYAIIEELFRKYGKDILEKVG